MTNVVAPLTARRTSRIAASAVALACLSVCGFSGIARAGAIPVAIDVCSTCASQTDLYNSAQSYYWSNYGNTPTGYVGTIQPGGLCSNGPTSGTVILVVSSAQPLSGTFWFCYTSTGGFSLPVVQALNVSTDAQAIAADNIMFARSAKTGRIGLPSNLTVNETPELISQWLSSADGVPEVPGSQKIDLWHGITNFPQMIKATFINTQTGESFQLWNGDTITVTDSNGWTAKFQWTPLSTVQWALVPNSIRDQNGNAPSSATSNNTGTGQAIPTNLGLTGAIVSITFPNGYVLTIEPYNVPTPQGIITIEPIGNGDSTYSIGNMDYIYQGW